MQNKIKVPCNSYDNIVGFSFFHILSDGFRGHKLNGCDDDDSDDSDDDDGCQLGEAVGSGNFSNVFRCLKHPDRVIKIQNKKNIELNEKEVEISRQFENEIQRYSIKSYGVRYSRDYVGFEMENMVTQGYETIQNIITDSKFINSNNDYIQQITIGLLWVLYNLNNKMCTIHSDLNCGNVFVNLQSLKLLSEKYKSIKNQKENNYFNFKYVGLLREDIERSAIVLGDFAFSISLDEGNTNFKDIINGCSLYLSPESIERGDGLIKTNEEVYAVGILLLEMFLKSGSIKSNLLANEILNHFKTNPILLRKDFESNKSPLVIRFKTESNEFKYIYVESKLKKIVYLVFKLTQKDRLDPNEILNNISNFFNDQPPNYCYYDPGEEYLYIFPPKAFYHSSGLCVSLPTPIDFTHLLKS